MGAGLLSAAIWIPILTGVMLLAVGNDRRADVVRAVALAGSLRSPISPVEPAAGYS